MPTSACPFRSAAQSDGSIENARVFPILNVFGKLKPGVTRERAAAAVDVDLRRFTADDNGAYRPGSGFTATTLDVRDEMTRNARPMLLILLGHHRARPAHRVRERRQPDARPRAAARPRARRPRGARRRPRAGSSVNCSPKARCWPSPAALCGLLFAAWTIGLLTTFVGALHAAHRRNRHRRPGAAVHGGGVDAHRAAVRHVSGDGVARRSRQRDEAGQHRRRRGQRTPPGAGRARSSRRSPCRSCCSSARGCCSPASIGCSASTPVTAAIA